MVYSASLPVDTCSYVSLRVSTKFHTFSTWRSSRFLPAQSSVAFCGAALRRGSLQGFSRHSVQPRFAVQNILEGPDDF